MGGIGHVMSKAWGYAVRGAKVYGPTVFGTGQEAMGAAYKAAITTKNPLKGQFWKDVWTGTKAAGKAAEGHAAAEKALHGNFWKSTWTSIRDLPKSIAKDWKAGGVSAAKAGKFKLWGNIKGAFGSIGKKMPLIGSLLIVAFELPNIIKATYNEGIVQGLAETAKAGARLGGASLMGALGTALGGPIGGFVGFIAGDWLTSKIVGKSYSERKTAEKEKIAQALQTVPQQVPGTTGGTTGVTNPYAAAMSPQQLMMMQQMLNSGNMNDDFMYQAYMKQKQTSPENLDIKA